MNKKIILIISLVVVAILAFVAYTQFGGWSDNQTVELTKETVTNEEFDLTFSYPVGKDGLMLIEPPATENGLLKSYLLMRADEYQEYSTATEPREAPMSISVLIFTLDQEKGTSTTGVASIDTDADPSAPSNRENRIARLQNWALDNDALTSFSMAKATPDIAELDGVRGLHYKADGLYQQDIYLASYRNRVYMFTAQYNEETDLTYTSFQELIQSISF